MRRFSSCLLALLVLLTVGAAVAQQMVLHVPGEYPTIQSAIDQAGFVISSSSPADVLIEVSPGTYPESVLLNAINSPTYVVTLRGVAGPLATIIDSSEVLNHNFFGHDVQNFVLDGFTVRARFDPVTACCWRGINLNDSNHITVQNSHFDTSWAAMRFAMRKPGVTSDITVVHNTVIAGQGMDPAAPDFVTAQAVDFSAVFNPADPLLWTSGPASHSKVVVAHNVLRTIGGSCVRFILPDWAPDGVNLLAVYPKASLTMVGNDVSCQFAAGVNVVGGHGNLIAGNRMHDSATGANLIGMYSGRIENNIIVRNYNGLLFFDNPLLASPILVQPTVVDHNTIVNNVIGGIVYSTNAGQPRANIPVVTNNIVAFNEGGGLVAVESNDLGTAMTYIGVDFHAAQNDVYANTVRGLYTPNAFFNFSPITNPLVSDGNYGGVIKTGLDLSVNPSFTNSQTGDFSLKPNSSLVNASGGPGPMRDFAGAMRDSKPDIGALEYVVAPNINVRANPYAKSNKPRSE